MKTTTLSTIALMLGLTGLLQAQAPEGEPKRPGPGGPPPKEILEKFDKDGDGKLNEEERKAAREAMQAKMAERHKEMLAKFDTDGDGKLSEEERKAAREARQKEILAKFDKDGDGQLSEEEKKAAREAMGGGRPQRPGGKGGPGRGGPGGPGGQGGPGPQ